ncbi:MAG TPA: thiamine-phosphate kinase [Candidatus Polarisedimenticolaceae bacterium]|nr:thiamine-phosphate kinase [Candidatus Polarisedimenticolaceae bacterium]
MSAGPQRVAEIGEFELIERLRRLAGPPTEDVVVGIGDDVAVIATSTGRRTVVTCDAQVEGTHFDLARRDPERLGRKAAAINLSDIAAAGGRPRHALVSLVLAPETPVVLVESLYRGLVAELSRFGACIVGGNLASGERLVVDVTLFGDVEPRRLLRRSGARVGDRLLVTGTLGAAAAGLRLASEPSLGVSPSARQRADEAFETPRARIGEVQTALDCGGVHAAIDVSDGLAADLAHLCDASDVGVELDAASLPIDPAAREVARAAGLDVLHLALGGGEDYELLLAVGPAAVDRLSSAVAERTGTPITPIGTIVDRTAGRRLVGPGGTSPLGRLGFRHFETNGPSQNSGS